MSHVELIIPALQVALFVVGIIALTLCVEAYINHRKVNQ